MNNKIHKMDLIKVDYNILRLRDSKAIHLYLYLCSEYDYKKGMVFSTYDKIKESTGLDRNTISKKLSILKGLRLIENVDGENSWYKVNFIDCIFNNTDVEEISKPYYVYAHMNLDNEILYIGKGTGNRAYDLNNRNEEYCNFINTYGKNNIKIKYIEHFELESEAYHCEEIMTRYLKGIGLCKYNIKAGLRIN